MRFLRLNYYTVNNMFLSQCADPSYVHLDMEIAYICYTEELSHIYIFDLFPGYYLKNYIL